ncbi:MAG: ABC transporter permease [Microbacterium sp.]
MTILEAPPVARSLGDRITRVLVRWAPLGLIVGMCVYLALATPFFFTVRNLSASLTQAAPVAVVAMALALVVVGGGDDAVTGGIDLSLPATAALATVILSDQLVHGTSFALALLLAVAVAVVIGLANAILVGVVGLSSILATLAMYVAVVGITRFVSANKRIDVSDPTIQFVRDQRVFEVPVSVILMLVVLLVLTVVMRRTPYGVRLQAVGGNRSAAEAAGLRVNRYVMSTFVIAGLLAGLASVLLVARGSGSSPGIDERLLVDMVLATFLGAAFSRRGIVTVGGAALGAIFVALMANGLILVRVDNSWVDGWKGLLILVVVAAAALRAKETAS